MFLKETLSGTKLEAVIEFMNVKDFKAVKKDSNRFNNFDWDKYKAEEVYKLRLKTDKIILGLMCLKDHTDEATNAIEIELLEVSNDNIGKKKKFDNIAASLIAYACRESFKRGHDGCVFLTPKTFLVEHYHSKYGFYYLPLKTLERPIGLMILYEDGARKMIKKYLDY
jgi:hypothetical protein